MEGSLCNEFLLQFSVDVSQTVLTYFGHIENMHVGVDREVGGARINLDRITVF